MKLWRRERETTWLLWSWLLGLWRGRRGSLTKRDELGEVGGYISSPRSSRPSFSSALSPIVRLSDSVRRLELCDVKETVYIWCRQRFQLFLIAPRGRYTSYGLLRRSFRHSFLVTIRKKRKVSATPLLQASYLEVDDAVVAYVKRPKDAMSVRGNICFHGWWAPYRGRVLPRGNEERKERKNNHLRRIFTNNIHLSQINNISWHSLAVVTVLYKRSVCKCVHYLHKGRSGYRCAWKWPRSPSRSGIPVAIQK